MKWIKKFESDEFEDKSDLDRLDEDEKIEEYFQDLIDEWNVKIEYIDSDNYDDNFINIVIEIGDDLLEKMPNLQRMHKDIESAIDYDTIDDYFKFMSDLKKCVDHLTSSSEGKYRCLKLTQNSYSQIVILIEIND
jgi:hypothetical protein